MLKVILFLRGLDAVATCYLLGIKTHRRGEVADLMMGKRSPYIRNLVGANTKQWSKMALRVSELLECDPAILFCLPPK
ncbi:MAG: hypothetical protein V4474_02570 [Patescibacteria group bacterium]